MHDTDSDYGAAVKEWFTRTVGTEDETSFPRITSLMNGLGTLLSTLGLPTPLSASGQLSIQTGGSSFTVNFTVQNSSLKITRVTLKNTLDGEKKAESHSQEQSSVTTTQKTEQP